MWEQQPAVLTINAKPVKFLPWLDQAITTMKKLTEINVVTRPLAGSAFADCIFATLHADSALVVPLETSLPKSSDKPSNLTANFR